jgi:hypothetical protein
MRAHKSRLRARELFDAVAIAETLKAKNQPRPSVEILLRNASNDSSEPSLHPGWMKTVNALDAINYHIPPTHSHVVLMYSNQILHYCTFLISLYIQILTCGAMLVRMKKSFINNAYFLVYFCRSMSKIRGHEK